MNYSKDDFKALFQAKFDYNKWFAMLKDFFKVDELRNTAEPISDPADCDKGYYIGAINTSDSYRIGLFYYEIGHSNVARKKVGLRNLVRTFINPNWGQFDAALAVFSDGKRWRLSLISDIKGEATAAKRYTFVFGEQDNLYRTAIERFSLIRSEGPSFEVLKKAFSVEALTEEFFGLYKDHYERFCDFIYQNADDRRYFGPEFAEWNRNKYSQKFIRDYVKNLMGRIVFLQFVQKKGWMGVPTDRNDWVGGDPYFMQHLYDYATEEQKDDFLDEVLEPLFFNCLNVLRPNDVFDTKVKGIGVVKVPYLNGELFEQKEVDKVQSKFPKKYFHDLLNLFLQYNFTIDENDPNDAEIGVDPEMLGKIFENLLEDNKDKGAFYTPKEIVRYMCKESLISYLCSNNGVKHADSIKVLVNNHQLTPKLQEDVKTCERLNKHLRNVKVCDPAIGSGAFPMGLMNEIFACRSVLHENIEETNDETSGQIKREIIQNNIYGVDIEQGAVDIARLRFWLALVVDSVKPEPLPNLDYKIMQGNSLIESYKGLDLANLLHNDNLFVATKADELGKYMKNYFRATDNEEKRKLRNQIDFTVKQCIYAAGIQDTIELPNTDFFLWHTYFHDVFKEGGFDIVIGNPPYVQLSKLPNVSEYYKKTLRSTYGTSGGRLNLFIFMLHQAINIANENGVITFIIPNTILTQEYYKDTRELILKHHLRTIVDYNDMEFDNAVVENVTLVISKDSSNDNSVQIFSCKGHNVEFVKSISSEKFKKQKGFIFNINSNDFVDRLFENSTPLSELCNINQAIALKGDKSLSVKNEYSNGYYKVLDGRNIGRYSIDWGVLYLDYDVERIHSCKRKDIFECKEKLFFRRVSANLMATYDDSQYFALNTLVVITPKEKCNIKYILALFNSTLMNYIYKNKFKSTKKVFSEIQARSVGELPIKSDELYSPLIINLVERIISAKKSCSLTETSEEEQEIDRLVYHLYGLTYDEVKIVDPETTITEEEYNNGSYL